MSKENFLVREVLLNAMSSCNAKAKPLPPPKSSRNHPSKEAEPSRRAKRNLFDDDGSDGNEDEYVPKNYGNPVECK